MKKRVFSLFLVLVMALSLCVTTAWADEHTNHCVCGATHTSVGDHTAATTDTWTKWDKTNELPTTSGSYYLTTNVTVTGQWDVSANITLCLNGHTIKSTNNSTDFIYVDNRGVTLTLTDCVGGGKVQGGYHIARIVQGTFNMYGGTITGKNNKAFGAVSVGSDSSIVTATFNMYGGTITGNKTTKSDSAYTNGGGVFINSNSTFNMYGGIISNNTASGSGAGVCNEGTFNMYNGTISGNESVNGGGVNNTGTFKMSGGTISSNKATADRSDHGKGGGVYSSYDFEMSGGTISGNSASEGGGGVYVGSSSSFTLSGGSIKDNTCTNGSAVYNAGTIKAAGGTISGTIVPDIISNSDKYTLDDHAVVYFDAVGGSPIPEAQHLFGGGHKATKPADPTREGFKFLYWYDDDKGDDTVYYNFDETVTYNRHLKAKWEEIPSDPVVDPVEEPTVSGGHTPIRRQNTTAVTTDTTPADTTTKTDTVTSAKTFDVGTAVYGVLAVTSLLGMGYVGKKR